MGKKKGRSVNPTDAYRKQLRKKEKQKVTSLLCPFKPNFSQNKKERQKTRDLHSLIKDPNQIEEQLHNIEALGNLHEIMRLNVMIFLHTIIEVPILSVD